VQKRIAFSVILLAAVCTFPVRSQEYSKFAFDIGGGVSTPLNPTAHYVGLGGNFVTGAGYNIDKHNSILGEFMWSGMPPDLSVIQPPNAPYGKINLYSLTANYRFKFDRLGHSPFGVYLIGGGGWYYRHVSINQNYVVQNATVCQPIYDWYGYSCGPGNYVYTATLASKGVSAPGVNGGVGFTIRLGDSGLKFYVESRYHYAFSDIPSKIVPVTFGFRFN
jgi:hypothetical protein